MSRQWITTLHPARWLIAWQVLVDEALQDADSAFSARPALKRSSSNGYPGFEVKFRFKAELEAAAPMNDTFRAKVGEIFKNYGSRCRRFIAYQTVEKNLIVYSIRTTTPSALRYAGYDASLVSVSAQMESGLLVL